MNSKIERLIDKASESISMEDIVKLDMGDLSHHYHVAGLPKIRATFDDKPSEEDLLEEIRDVFYNTCRDAIE